MPLRKHYIATAFNGHTFALIVDKKPNEKIYQKVVEVTSEECEAQAKATDLVTDLNGVIGSYKYNRRHKEFECNYRSGTNYGANDWGFAKRACKRPALKWWGAPQI